MSKSPIKYFGGKGAISDWIVSLMPEHLHYVEPYAGGLSVLFSKPNELVERHSEVVNDIDREIVNFFRVLQSDELRGELLKRLQFTPFAESEFYRAVSDLQRPILNFADVDAAIDFYIKNRQSRQGNGSGFATLSRNRVRRGMNEQVSSWWTAIAELPDFAERLKRVVLLNKPAIDVIESNDGPSSLIYADPPYLLSTRSGGGYKFEMTEREHAELLETLACMEGKFLLSGYHSKLYDDWAKKFGFEVFEKEVVAHSSSARKKPSRVEVIWRKS